MPSPIETLLRIHPSPLPAQTTFGSFGSMASEPIDCTSCLSKTGLNVVPPLVDFHTPPLAAPTYTVRRSPSCTAASAATRPLIAAEPMLRAPSPDVVSESTKAATPEAGKPEAGKPEAGSAEAGSPDADAGSGAARGREVDAASAAVTRRSPAAGLLKRRSSSSTFSEMRSHEYCCLFALELPFSPMANENGKSTPCTAL